MEGNSKVTTVPTGTNVTTGETAQGLNGLLSSIGKNSFLAFLTIIFLSQFYITVTLLNNQVKALQEMNATLKQIQIELNTLKYSSIDLY